MYVMNMTDDYDKIAFNNWLNDENEDISIVIKLYFYQYQVVYFYYVLLYQTYGQFLSV